jgi:hypothetical protein
MVTQVKENASRDKMKNTRSFVTPFSGEDNRKRLRLTSPMLPHAIATLRTSTVEVLSVGKEADTRAEMEVSAAENIIENEVALDHLDGLCENVNDEIDDDNEMPLGGGSNLLIPEIDFITFITNNFVCKSCNSGCWTRLFQTDKIGCATNIFWKCSNNLCEATGKILAKQSTKDISGKFRRKHKELPSALGDYDINRQVVLACQQSGGGAKMASTFGGIMSLTNRSVWMNSFSALEQLLGKAQIRLGKEILEQNLRDEIALSPIDPALDRAQVTLMMDGGWDQRASGKAYNSCSGRVVSIGARTNKVCYLVYYSKRCTKCEKGSVHSCDLCANPEKYDRSSKAMESLGSVETILSIWKKYPKAYVKCIVTDEDATTRSKLSHSFTELFDAGKITDAERRYEPKKPGRKGKKRPDNGVLPLDHPEIDKLSDPIHFVKNYKSELYALVALAKKNSETCKGDAVRLSRNLSYMMAQYAPTHGPDALYTFDDFANAGKASFEHHWNNHEFCGDWCQPKKWTDEMKEKYKHKYRDKVVNKREYEQQFEIREKFMSTPRMKRVWHKWKNNKTESIHSQVVNVFLPKKSFFSLTICGRARTYLAVSIDSLGYLEYYRRLYAEVGIEMSDVTEKYYQQHDRSRETQKAYVKSEKRKKIKAARKLENIVAEWKREVVDKKDGTTYKSKIATKEDSTEGGKKKRGRKATRGEVGGATTKKILFCTTCKNYGHQRITSKLCPQNKKRMKNVYSEGTEGTYEYAVLNSNDVLCPM